MFSFLFENIEIDSFRDVIFELIYKGLQTEHKDKFIELFDIVLYKLKEPSPDKFQFQNLIWLIVALCRMNEDIYHKIYEILSIVISIYIDQNDSNEIYSIEECDKNTLLMQLITNILFIALKNNNPDIYSYNLCITNLIDTNLFFSEMYDLSNIDLLTDFSGSNIEAFKYICRNFDLIYSIYSKCKLFLQKEKKNSSCNLFLSNILDTLIILLNFNPKFPIITPDLLLNLINVMIEFPKNSIINQKIYGIFLLFEKENFDSKTILEKIEKILSKENFEEILIRNKIISNKSEISIYLIYFINIYISLNGNNRDILYLIKQYNEINSKGLFKREIFNKNIMSEKELEQIQNINDISSFLINTKKLLEDVKNVSIK